MKTHSYKPLGLCLLLFFGVLASAQSAEPQLNGLAPHQELGKERFIAALYAEKPASDPNLLMANGARRRMELRVTANRYSARRLNSMWIEGMAVNNSGEALTQHAQNMVAFTSMLKKGLMSGDILTIESVPSLGTQVSVNGVKLGTIQAEDFFTMLLRTWIGPVPLSSDFRDALLQAGKIDNNLLARYEATTPTAARIASVEAWVAPSAEPSEPKNIAPAELPAPDVPTLKPAPTIAAAPTKPQLPESSPSEAKASSKPKIETKPQTAAKPKPKTMELVVAEPFPDDEILDEDDLEEEEDAPILTAESLLSRQLYHSKLLKWTYQYLKYPQRAQKRGQEGSVRLSVVIDRSGNLKRVAIVEESRYDLLNKEARGAVNRANPFPPMPEEMSGETFSFSLPIVFRIK